MKVISSKSDILNQDFIACGFRFITSEYYMSKENLASLHDLKKLFDTELEEDGLVYRKRAYLKLCWNKLNDLITVPMNQVYYQTPQSNKVDGGHVRQFKGMHAKVLEIPIVKSIITKNLKMLRHYQPLKMDKYLTVGLHFIRYEVSESGASYSSPDWLHQDDEPLVFIHLIHLSRYALGGDNLIADSSSQKITHVVRLENEIDTLVLNKNVYHAVTPLGSRKGVASRDVILFTVEPQYSQQCEMETICA